MIIYFVYIKTASAYSSQSVNHIVAVYDDKEKANNLKNELIEKGLKARGVNIVEVPFNTNLIEGVDLEIDYYGYITEDFCDKYALPYLTAQ